MPKQGAQTVHRFGPIRIFTNGLSQKARLRVVPEGRLVQMHAVFQGASVLMDEVLYGRISVFQAELGEQGGQVVGCGIHIAVPP